MQSKIPLRVSRYEKCKTTSIHKNLWFMREQPSAGTLRGILGYDTIHEYSNGWVKDEDKAEE